MKLSLPQKTAVAVAVVIVLAGANTLAFARFGNPLGAVRAQASAFGYEGDRLPLVEGGYSSRGIGWKAHGVFRVEGEPSVASETASSADAHDGPRWLSIELVRTSLLHPWQLASYQIRDTR